MAVSAGKGAASLKSRNGAKADDLLRATDKDSEPTKEKILGQKSRKRKEKEMHKPMKVQKAIESYVEGSAMTMSNPTPNVRSTNKQGHMGVREAKSGDLIFLGSSQQGVGSNGLLKQVREPTVGQLNAQLQSSLS